MRIAVLASGGVDSSVVLRLMAAEHPGAVTAFYLKVWLEDELAFLGECPWEDDLAQVRAVCETAGVPLEVISLQRPYHDIVVAYTVAELRAGRTPSPDIFCNRHIKFGAFHDAVGREFDVIATGHYARTRRNGEGRSQLLRGIDPIKDQTYFLSRLTQEQLARCHFPIGDLHKPEVRALAARWELPNAARRDSQGICFLGKLRYDDFVRSHLGERPGKIRERSTGRVLGTHRGTWFHTIGQRRGLGLSGGPWFVVGKDLAHDVVLVAHQDQLAAQSRDTFPVAALHWIDAPPADPARLGAKLRHGETVYPCALTLEVADPTRGTVRLTGADDPGVAPGQFAVFYDGEVCLGGGVIDG